LFREFLQAQSKESFPSDELSGIEHRAAMILAADGQVEEAVKLLVKTEKWSDLVPLILEQAPALVSQGRSQTLEAWLGSLPGPLAEENPWLLYWLGVCRLPFSPPESSPFFVKAFNLFRARREAAGVFLALSGLFDSTTYGTADFKAYDQWIDLLKQIRKEYKTFPSEEIEARLTASVTFAVIARRPEQPELETWIERALYLVNRSPDIHVKTRTLQSLASHYIFAGNLSKAALIIDSFQEITHSPDIPPLLLILLNMLEAMYDWMSGSFEECRKAANRGLDLAASTGVHLWDAFLLGHAAAGALSKGDTAEARGFLQRISPTLGRVPTWAKEYYHVLAAWASFVEGDLPNALSHAESSVAFSAETGMVLTEAFDRLGKAFVLVESKREKEAKDQIKLVWTKARSLNLPLVEFTCLLAQARLAFNQGDESSGLESLKTAMILGREQGYLNTFFWHAPIMADLCRKALDADIEVEYVRTLIRKRSLHPDHPPYACEQWPWPLKILTLGRFELVKDGEPLEFEVKAPRKMLSLIKALVASGRRGLSEEQLTDAIWPEAEGDQAHQAFATILHRLRQLLGNKKVIRLRKGHLRLDDRFCWTDAHAFEYLIEKADAQEDMPLLQTAVRLYGGPFLGDDDSEPWAISYRERLRSKFLRAIGKLGRLHERKGEREKAVDLYQIGLEVDGLAEEFYQRLMLCYHASGRKAEALAVYARCRENLMKILGIEPSQQTQAIYESLRREK
jgi:DNA-binding SARP family transcriptional activator